MPATSWTERNQSAPDGWDKVRYAGLPPTEFVLIGGVLIPAEGSSEEIATISWTERSIGATSFAEKTQSAVTWTEKT